MEQLIFTYLAGSMEQISEEESSSWRNECKLLTKDTRIRAISPTDYYTYGNCQDASDFEIMRFDLHKVKTSDIVLVNLEHLRKSIGTCDEILYAYMNQIPVVGFLETEEELTKEELVKLIHPWKWIQINRIETGKNAMAKALDYINAYY